MTPYADVEFYTNEFLQGRAEVIPLTEFNYWANKASQFIDQHTFNRVEVELVNRIIKEVEVTIELAILTEVKMATCEIAEAFYNNNEATSLTAKRSETVGQYSVSYADQKQAQNEFNAQLRSILSRWLGNTDLLYRGV